MPGAPLAPFVGTLWRALFCAMQNHLFEKARQQTERLDCPYVRLRSRESPALKLTATFPTARQTLLEGLDPVLKLARPAHEYLLGEARRRRFQWEVTACPHCGEISERRAWYKPEP